MDIRLLPNILRCFNKCFTYDKNNRFTLTNHNMIRIIREVETQHVFMYFDLTFIIKSSFDLGFRCLA
jgi:hypothetical protein